MPAPALCIVPVPLCQTISVSDTIAALGLRRPFIAISPAIASSMTAFIMRARTLGTSFVLVAAICQLMGKAASHGLIAYPPMRTAFTPFFGANDCPYCLNGGGACF